MAPTTPLSSSSSYSSRYYDNDDDDMGFKKFGSFLSSLKNEAKPLLSTLATEAKAKGSSLYSETQARYQDYSNGTRSEFTSTKDNSRSRQPKTVVGDDGNVVSLVPNNSEITLYQSYTLLKQKYFYVEVRGWLTAPGTMSSKNKLVFSLAKQLIKPGAHKATTALVANFAMQTTGHTGLGENLNHSQSYDTMSINSMDSLKSSNTLFFDENKTKNENELTEEDILKERMAFFFAKSLANVPLNIIVCSEEAKEMEELVTKEVITDLNGKFEIILKVPYKPSIVQVSVSHSNTDEEIFAIQETLYIQPKGISIISDIDDTIKHTEVLADKRTVFNNVFIRDLKSEAIRGVPELYQSLYENGNCLFHYVSNSPWQLYPTIRKFFEVCNYPPGSIHLKQYTGNILSSLMEPAVERKMQTLFKIFEEFPERKFILIGDSGEQDFDAYTKIACRYPKQVIRIYIRVVPDSLSDFNDIRILREIKKLLMIREEKINLKKDYMKFAAKINDKSPTPPPIPKRRTNTIIDEDSSSPETSDDEMEKPNYDWNILSHQQKSAISPEPMMLSIAQKRAIDSASTSIRSTNIATDVIFPKKKPPLPARINRSKPNISKQPTALSAEPIKKKPPPPVIPRKPTNLRAAPTTAGSDSSLTKSFNEESSMDLKNSESYSSLLRRSSTNITPVSNSPTFNLQHSSTTFNNTNDYDYDKKLIQHSATDVGIISSGSSYATQVVDNKGKIWLERVSNAMNVLPEELKVMFWISPNDIEDDSLSLAELWKD